MSLDEAELLHKIKKVGGLKVLFLRRAKDFYFAFSMAAIIFIIIILAKSDIDRIKGIISFFIIPFISVNIGLISLSFVYTKREIDNNKLKEKMHNSGFLPEIEFYVDYPIFINIISLLFGFFVCLSLNFIISNINVATLLISSLVFFFLYSIGTFIYSIRALNYYKLLENKFTKKEP